MSTPEAAHPASAAGFRSLGQPVARAIVERTMASGRLGTTLLVHGPAGAGAEAFVDDLLALALCTDPDAGRRPCNACRGCRDARARAHPDLVVGSPDAWRVARATGESIVAAARRWLLDAAGAPIAGERRVVLIEGADRANEQTQNALLKALEEPSPRHLYILVADEPSRLLPTIRSRCQPLRIGPVPMDELVAWLVDQERVPADEARRVARMAHGLSGSALAYARAPALRDWRERTQRELLDLLGRGRAERFAAARELLDDTARLAGRDDPVPDDGEEARPAIGAQRAAAVLLVEAWIALARDLLVAAAGSDAATAAGGALPELAERAARIGPAQAARTTRRLEEVHDALMENAAPRLAIETAMLAWPTLPPASGAG